MITCGGSSFWGLEPVGTGASSLISPIFDDRLDIRTFWPYLRSMNSAITMLAKDSKDMDRLFSGMKEKIGAASYIVVDAQGSIIDAACDMRIARDLARFAGRGTKVKSVHSSRIVFIAA